MVKDIVEVFHHMTVKHIDQYSLRDHFFNTEYYYSNGDENMQNIIMGSIVQESEKEDRFVIEDLTKFLFANLDQVGHDLVARNIQRGRDHGLPCKHCVKSQSIFK